jgi:hypothetical protein
MGLCILAAGLFAACNFSATTPQLTSWAIRYEAPDSALLSGDLSTFQELANAHATSSNEMVQACKSGSTDALQAFHHPNAPDPQLAASYNTYLFIAIDMFNKCQIATAHADSDALSDMNADLVKLKMAQEVVNKQAVQLGFYMKVGIN